MTIEELAKILVPTIISIFSAAGWLYKRLEKKFDKLEEKINNSNHRMEEKLVNVEERVSKRIYQLEDKIDDLKGKLGRIEGAFYERGYWESRKLGGDK